MNNLTFKQYQYIDLAIFSVLLVISEAITTVATNTWFAAQPIAISTTLIFICIIMMRWSWYAIIPACLGGLVFCVACGARPEQYLTYAVGNCAALSAMLWFKVWGKEKTRLSRFKLCIFVLTAYVSMQLGRWVLSLPFGARLDTLVAFLATDIISLLFAGVVIVLMRGTDGMIEDQKAYLFRLQREREAEKEISIDRFGDDTFN
jgi:hypothetical protein